MQITEEERARNAFMCQSEYERDLYARLYITELSLIAAKEYMKDVAEPGWPEVVGYASMAGTGVYLMELGAIAAVGMAAPGIFASVLAVTGFTLLTYGVYGASAYSLQAISRTFPGLPGAAMFSNKGEVFDSTLPFSSTKGNPLLAYGKEKIQDHIVDKFVMQQYAAKGVTHFKINIPSLLGKDILQEYIDWAEKEKERLESEIKKITPPKNTVPLLKQRQQQIRMHLGSESEIPIDGKRGAEGYIHEGRPYAGDDYPRENMQNIA